jgi:hypothetical protein
VVDCKLQIEQQEEVNFEWTIGATKVPAMEGSYTTYDLEADTAIKVEKPVSPLVRAVL